MSLAGACWPVATLQAHQCLLNSRPVWSGAQVLRQVRAGSLRVPSTVSPRRFVLRLRPALAATTVVVSLENNLYRTQTGLVTATYLDKTTLAPPSPRLSNFCLDLLLASSLLSTSSFLFSFLFPLLPPLSTHSQRNIKTTSTGAPRRSLRRFQSCSPTRLPR